MRSSSRRLYTRKTIVTVGAASMARATLSRERRGEERLEALARAVVLRQHGVPIGSAGRRGGEGVEQRRLIEPEVLRPGGQPDALVQRAQLAGQRRVVRR